MIIGLTYGFAGLAFILATGLVYASYITNQPILNFTIMAEETTEKKKFGALARKRGSKEPFVTCVIYAKSLDDAKKQFGELNYEVDGNVYARGK